LKWENAEKHDLQNRLKRTQDYLSRSINTVAHRNRKKAKGKEVIQPTPTHSTVSENNPYEGLFTARQLNESVDEFLKRVPVYGENYREISKDGWLWIANFRSESRSYDEVAFIKQGQSILEEFSERRKAERLGEAKRSFQSLKTEREKLKTDILDEARKMELKSGKVSLICNLPLIK
jgi:hypothetical protein